MRWTGYNDSSTSKRMRVLRLMEMLEKGPSCGHSCQPTMTPKEAEEDMKLWLSPWIIPQVKHLFPDIYDRKTGNKIPKKAKVK